MPAVNVSESSDEMLEEIIERSDYSPSKRAIVDKAIEEHYERKTADNNNN